MKQRKTRTQNKKLSSSKPSSLFGIWEDNSKIRSPQEYIQSLRKGRYIADSFRD